MEVEDLDHISESESLHREYLRCLKSKYSVLEKSIDGLKGRGINDIMRMRIPITQRKSCVELYGLIRLHEIYFYSFTDKTERISRRFAAVDRCFGSTSALAYELFCRARSEGEGFLCVYMCGDKIKIKRGSLASELISECEPVLCVDLWEHAYFAEYGFDRERYLRSSLERLDYARLDPSE